MPIFLTALWGKTKFYVAGAVAGLLALFMLYRKVKNDGVQEERERTKEHTDEVVEFEEQDRQRANAMSDADLRNSVRAERDRILSGK